MTVWAATSILCLHIAFDVYFQVNLTRLIYYYVTANFGYFVLKVALWLKLHHPFLQISFSLFYWRLHTKNQLPRFTGSALQVLDVG